MFVALCSALYTFVGFVPPWSFVFVGCCLCFVGSVVAGLLGVGLFPGLLSFGVVAGSDVGSASSHLGVDVGCFVVYGFVEVWYCFVIVFEVW